MIDFAKMLSKGSLRDSFEPKLDIDVRELEWVGMFIVDSDYNYHSIEDWKVVRDKFVPRFVSCSAVVGGKTYELLISVRIAEHVRKLSGLKWSSVASVCQVDIEDEHQYRNGEINCRKLISRAEESLIQAYNGGNDRLWVDFEADLGVKDAPETIVSWQEYFPALGAVMEITEDGIRDMNVRPYMPSVLEMVIIEANLDKISEALYACGAEMIPEKNGNVVRRFWCSNEFCLDRAAYQILSRDFPEDERRYSTMKCAKCDVLPLFLFTKTFEMEDSSSVSD